MSKNENEGFFARVYEVVLLVPHGRITTYGVIARYLGSAGSARMVGWALNQTKGFGQLVPAHRVVNRKGLLTGKRHFGGDATMAELLRSEGIEVEENEITDMDRYFWDPARELG